jgi:polyribonucleotide nucleotidyltransferase
MLRLRGVPRGAARAVRRARGVRAWAEASQRGQASVARDERADGSVRVSVPMGGRVLTLERGRIGTLADSVVFARFGEATVLLSAVSERERSAEDGVPLQVEYREKSFAAGVIPTSISRREGTVLESEVLAGRVVDRVLRPLFPKDYWFTTQLVASVTSVDADVLPEVLAINAASAALWASDIPWGGVTSEGVACAGRSGAAAAVHVGWLDGVGPVAFPNERERAESRLSLLYAGTRERTLMMEVQASELPEADLVRAMDFAQSHLHAPLAAIEALSAGRGGSADGAGGPVLPRKRRYEAWLPREADAGDWAAWERVRGVARAEASRLFTASEQPRSKEARARSQARVQAACRRELADAAPHMAADERRASFLAEVATDEALQWLILRDAPRLEPVAADAAAAAEASPPPAATAGPLVECATLPHVRPDGRTFDAIRPLRAETSVLPVVHGSALFSRGNTQVLCTATLGPPEIALLQRSLAGSVEEKKPFFLHYEMPPFSVNETGAMTGPNRRAVGHGALAEKAVAAVMPPDDEFPYAVRATSTVTGSDGSSSMATVCGTSLALLDAGVPIRRPVAGLSIGMVSDPALDTDLAPGGAECRFVLLTDILGLEDHMGDMDFKVAGTDRGVTAVQLDLKRAGVPVPVLARALYRAREGRAAILQVMERAIQGRTQAGLSLTAPRMELVPLPFHRRAAIVGPGGSVLKRLEKECSANLRVLDDGDYIQVFAKSEAILKHARTLLGDAIAGKLPHLLVPTSLPAIATLVPAPQVPPDGPSAAAAAAAAPGAGAGSADSLNLVAAERARLDRYFDSLLLHAKADGAAATPVPADDSRLRLLVGDLLWVRVEEVRDFGALATPIDMAGAPSGLLHIVEFERRPATPPGTVARRDMRDLARPGDLFRVGVVDVDVLGRGRFSRVSAMQREGSDVVLELEAYAKSKSLRATPTPTPPAAAAASKPPKPSPREPKSQQQSSPSSTSTPSPPQAPEPRQQPSPARSAPPQPPLPPAPPKQQQQGQVGKKGAAEASPAKVTEPAKPAEAAGLVGKKGAAEASPAKVTEPAKPAEAAGPVGKKGAAEASPAKVTEPAKLAEAAGQVGKKGAAEASPAKVTEPAKLAEAAGTTGAEAADRESLQACAVEEEWHLMSHIAKWGHLLEHRRVSMRIGASSRGVLIVPAPTDSSPDAEADGGVPMLQTMQKAISDDGLGYTDDPREPLAVDTTPFMRAGLPSIPDHTRLTEPMPQLAPLGVPDPLFVTPIRAPQRFSLSSATFRYLITRPAFRAWVQNKNPAWFTAASDDAGAGRDDLRRLVEERASREVALQSSQFVRLTQKRAPPPARATEAATTASGNEGKRS